MTSYEDDFESWMKQEVEVAERYAEMLKNSSTWGKRSMAIDMAAGFAKFMGSTVVVATQVNPQELFEVSSLEETEAFLTMTPWFSSGREWKLTNSVSGKFLVMSRDDNQVRWGRRVIYAKWLLAFSEEPNRLTTYDHARTRAFIWDTWGEIE